MASPYSRTMRALGADGARASWVAWGVAGALGLAWLGWFTLGRVTVYEVSQAARLESLAAAHPVAALQGGALARSHLALGRPVKAGELLLELDDRSAALRLREEAERLQALPARRSALQAEVQALQQSSLRDEQAAAAAVRAAQARAAEVAAQQAFARDYERRLADEVRGGGIAEVDLLRARAETRRHEAQQATLAAEAERLALEAQARAGQVRARSAALQGPLAAVAAEATTLSTSVARLQAEQERLRVRAPVDGVLADVAALRPGAWVGEGQHVATVLPPGRLRVVAEFLPATALGRVQAGQAAQVRLDGFPWAQHGSLAARVDTVAGEVREQRLRAELAIEPGSSLRGLALQHGQSGRVEVALEAVSPAVLLLRSMGQRLSDGRGDAAAGSAAPVPVAERGR
jgi:membrane fusion protein (multidrug efflux system)